MVCRSIVLLALLLIYSNGNEIVEQELEVEQNDTYKENVINAINPELREKMEHLMKDISQEEDEEEYLRQHLSPEEQEHLARTFVERLIPIMPDNLKEMYYNEGGDQFILESLNHTNTPNETEQDDEGGEDESGEDEGGEDDGGEDEGGEDEGGEDKELNYKDEL